MSKTRKRHRISKAKQADKYDLYQKSVQEPECEVTFFQRVFKKEYHRPALVIREDFCGTAAVCCEWVRKHPERRAIGVDFDPEPLAWCRENNANMLTESDRARLTLLEDDVRKVYSEKCDVLAAQNFSFYIFKTRDELRNYFNIARQNLADEGVMIMDIMGGSEMLLEDHEDETEKEGFTYFWEQVRFDPITHDAKFHIHFRFDDGSTIKKAFTYEWRLWIIPEVKELLLEAGFSRVDVYWEGSDKDGDGDGIFRLRKHAPADPAWVSYVVAIK